MWKNMTISDWATTLSGFLAVFVTIGASVRWLIRHYIAGFKNELIEYLIELKPNHGSSLNDIIRLEVLPTVKELRENQIEIGIAVAKLEGKFEQHIEEHAVRNS
jgi:hypothetical protein